MKLGELMEMCDYGTLFELHDSMNGKMVANTEKMLEKYESVEVIGFHPIFKSDSRDRRCSFVRAILFVWGSHKGILAVREQGKEQK